MQWNQFDPSNTANMKKAFIFDRAKMTDSQQERTRAFLHELMTANLCTMIDVPNKPAKAAKVISKHDYPEWFESLWKNLPNKLDKPATLQAAKDVVSQGYTVEDIEKGIPAYAKEEKRRSTGSDYRKHSPARWIANHRFLDEQTENPRSPNSVRAKQPEPKGWQKEYEHNVLEHSDFQHDWQLIDPLTRIEIIEHMNSK